MKIYFMETTFRDNSRAGYDDTFIDYSLTPFASDEIGPTSVTYAVEVGEGYSQAYISPEYSEIYRGSRQRGRLRALQE